MPALAAWMAAAAAALHITHEPPGCLRPDRHPVLRARVEPITEVLRARVLFRTEGGAEPHAVVMRQEGDGFRAELPRPAAGLDRVLYMVEAADGTLQET